MICALVVVQDWLYLRVHFAHIRLDNVKMWLVNEGRHSLLQHGDRSQKENGSHKVHKPTPPPFFPWLSRWEWNIEKNPKALPTCSPPPPPRRASLHACLLTSPRGDLAGQSLSSALSFPLARLPAPMMSHAIWFSARIKPEKRFSWKRGEKRRRFGVGRVQATENKRPLFPCVCVWG